jgi:proteasome lid subunit RPN8/RPN11
MTESCSEGLLGTWAPPECPFKIAYSLRALDDIRLAVADAFFSLPRGGAEIGGILLGKRDGQQITILDYVALDCEHAFGPSFTLSPRDLAHLSILIEEARKNMPALQPAGWYHSHTRSDIFLSEADLEIHKRYFSAPWQVALVLKPHTFHPTRAGFFFRAADGAFHTQASYQEFELDPLPLRPIPSATAPLPAAPGGTVRLDSSPTGRVITMPTAAVSASADPEVASESPAELASESDTAAADPASESAKPPGPVLVPDPEPHAPTDDVPIHFPDLSPAPRWRPTAIVGLATVLAVGALGFETRQFWLPRIWHGAQAGTGQNSVTDSLGLVLADHDGLLRIGWDRKASAVQAATRGTLEISSGGGIPSATRLDTAQLQSGSFTYKRETEKVDVILSVDGPIGELGRESVSFLGKLPPQVGGSADPAAAVQSEALAVEVERLKGELKAQVAKNQQLLKSMDQRGDMTAEVERLQSQLNAQAARIKDIDKASRAKDDQLTRLRSDLNTQISHNRVLAQALDEAQSQLKLQQKKRMSNQNADTAKQ